MWRISRKVEYGVMALAHLGREAHDRPVSARDVARALELPEALLGKVLNRLRRAGLLRAEDGAAGGYMLARPLSRISLLDVLRAAEGQGGFLPCSKSVAGCPRRARCRIRPAMRAAEREWLQWLRRRSIASLVGEAGGIRVREGKHGGN